MFLILCVSPIADTSTSQGASDPGSSQRSSNGLKTFAVKESQLATENGNGGEDPAADPAPLPSGVQTAVAFLDDLEKEFLTCKKHVHGLERLLKVLFPGTPTSDLVHVSLLGGVKLEGFGCKS